MKRTQPRSTRACSVSFMGSGSISKRFDSVTGKKRASGKGSPGRNATPGRRHWGKGPRMAGDGGNLQDTHGGTGGPRHAMAPERMESGGLSLSLSLSLLVLSFSSCSCEGRGCTVIQHSRDFGCQKIHLLCLLTLGQITIPPSTHKVGSRTGSQGRREASLGWTLVGSLDGHRATGSTGSMLEPS